MPADKPTAISYDYPGAISAALEAHPEAKYLALAPVPKKGAPPTWKDLKRHRVDRPPADTGKSGVILLFARSIGAPITDTEGRAEIWRFRAPAGFAPAVAPTEHAAAAAPPAEGPPPAPEPGEEIDQESERLDEEDAAHLESLRPRSEEIAVSSTEEHMRYLTVRNAMNQGRQVPAMLDATTRLLAQVERNEEARHKREMELRQRIDDLESERSEDNRGGNIGNIVGSIAIALGPFVRAGVADRIAAAQQRQAPPLLTATPTAQDGQPIAPTAQPAAQPAAPAAAPPGIAGLLADPAKLQGLLTDPQALEVLKRHGISL